MIGMYDAIKPGERLPLERLINEVHKEFPGAQIEADKELRFYTFFIPEIERGDKDCTIRFRPNKLRLPDFGENGNLPCYATSPDDANYKELVGHVNIYSVLVAHVSDFPLELAQQDGFKNIKDMKKGIGEIYGVILQPNDLLSFYYLDEYFPLE